MSQRDLLRLIVANLNRMRGRVAMTAIGVVVGTTAVVLLISLAVGLQNSTSQQIDQFGDLTVITVFEGGRFGGPGAAAEGPEAALDRDALQWLEGLEHVQVVTPRVGLRGAGELRYGRESAFGQIVGVDPEAASQLGWNATAGRVRLGSGQIVVGHQVFGQEGRGRVAARRTGARRSGSVAVRPEQAAGSSLEPEEMAGRSVTLVLTKLDEEGNEITRRERLRVAGVLEESSGENDFSVFLDLAQVEELNRWFSGERRDPRASFEQVLVKVDDREHVEDVEAAITERGYNAFSAMSILSGINQVFLIIQLVFGGIGAVALLVAAIGIANTMTMAIYERTREIGIMKAVGASNNDVLRIFLGEAGAIGFLGGLLGALVGWGGGLVIDLFFRGLILRGGQGGDVPDRLVVTPLWLVAFALLFATLIGLISGVFPALRAANMKPLRALRSE